MQNEPLGRQLGKGANGKKKRPRRCTRAAAVGGPSYNNDPDKVSNGKISRTKRFSKKSGDQKSTPVNVSTLYAESGQT